MHHPPHPPLTQRQAEILIALAKGTSVRDIASSLGLATSTVKTHVRVLRGLYSAASQHELVAKAARTLDDLISVAGRALPVGQSQAIAPEQAQGDGRSCPR